MGPQITGKTIRQFIDEVSDQFYPMTGVVIAAMAAQAAALAETCMQISLDNQIDKLDWPDVTGRIEQMAHIKATLLEWCNQHAEQMADFMSRTDYQAEPRHILCDHSAEIGQLSIEAATMLQEFRPLVFAQVSDDMETTITLLVMTARAAMLLLDSNLRRWPDEALLTKYEPIRAELESQINQSTPLRRIRVSH
jgi:formiminotetrahydrofolate cyclodeaminase